MSLTNVAVKRYGLTGFPTTKEENIAYIKLTIFDEKFVGLIVEEHEE